MESDPIDFIPLILPKGLQVDEAVLLGKEEAQQTSHQQTTGDKA